MSQEQVMKKYHDGKQIVEAVTFDECIPQLQPREREKGEGKTVHAHWPLQFRGYAFRKVRDGVYGVEAHGMSFGFARGMMMVFEPVTNKCVQNAIAVMFYKQADFDAKHTPVDEDGQSVTKEVKSTPAAHWRISGEPDPHGKNYDCERASLTLGSYTDDELANAVFMHGNEMPSLDDVLAGKAKMPIVYLTAAKDRIRWLSRALEAALQNKPTTPIAAGLFKRDEQTKELVQVPKHYAGMPGVITLYHDADWPQSEHATINTKEKEQQ